MTLNTEIRLAPSGVNDDNGSAEIRLTIAADANGATLGDAMHLALEQVDANVREWLNVRAWIAVGTADYSKLAIAPLVRDLVETMRKLHALGVYVDARCMGDGEPDVFEALRELGATVDVTKLRREECDRANLQISKRAYEGAITASTPWRARTDIEADQPLEHTATVEIAADSGKPAALVMGLKPADDGNPL